MREILLLLALTSLVLACQQNEIDVNVIKHYATYGGEESFQIYAGTDNTGDLILDIQGADDRAYTDSILYICLVQGATYYVVLNDSVGDGWGDIDNPAYLMINVESITLFKGTLPYSSSRNTFTASYTFKANIATNSYTLWKYSDTPQISTAWRETSFDDSSWPSGSFFNYPSYGGITRYYRYTCNLPNRANISTVKVSINNSFGFICYIHGVEVYRFHMPAGNISFDTYATESDGQYSVVISINKFLLPVSGPFTVAFEVHVINEDFWNMDFFNSYIYLGREGEEGSLGMNVLFDGEASGQPEGPSGYTLNKIFDELTSTYYYTTSSATPTIIYQLNYGRAEWINYYSVVSAKTTSYGYPTSWTLYGSNDGNNWDVLDVQNNIVFSAPNTQLDFSLRGNTQSYNRFKFTMSSSLSGRIAVGAIYGFIGVFANEPAGLQYDSPSFTGYAGVDTVYMVPVESNYHTFTSNPPLPEGVTLNPTTGVISGIPIAASSGTYTISAINISTSQPSQTEITLDIQSCSGPARAIVRFVKVSLYEANQESYIVTDSAGQNYTSPVFYDEQTQYVYYCFPTGVIHVHLIGNFYGWCQDTKLDIQLSDGEGGFYSIASLRQRQGSINDYDYEIGYKIPPQSSSWTYSTSLSANWYANGPVPGFIDFDPTNPPSSNGQHIWLFRTAISLTLAGYEGFDLRVLARAGYIIYINGIEFIRKDLPPGEINTATSATSGEYTSTYRYIIGPNSILTNGNNYIAIGIVNLVGNNPTTLLFDATLRQRKHNDIGRIMDVTPSSNPLGNNLSYLIDGLPYTYWDAEQPSKADFIIDFTFGNHRAEHFNKYCVTSSDSNEAFDPSDWTIYGSNDNQSFEPVANVTNAYFSDRIATRCFYMPNNRKSDNQYRMVVTETAVPTTSPYRLAIADIVFSMVDLDQLVVPPFSLDATSYTGYIGVPFPEITPSSTLFSDFSISPPLQLPLEIDTSTGSIRGTPNALLPRSTFTISAKTPKGETVTTQISLAVEGCLYPNNQFTILIQTGNNGNNMGLLLRDASGTTLINRSWLNSNQAIYYPFCKPTGTYTLTLRQYTSDSWENSYFRVLLADGTIVLFGSYSGNMASKNFNFFIGYLIAPLHESYKFLNNGSSAPADWIQPQSTAANSWQESMPGEFGNFVGTTAYFRKTFTVTDLNNYPAFAFTVKTTYGVVVYINGEQVLTYNMPEGAVSYQTTSLVKHNQLMSIGTSIPMQSSNLMVGTNVMCVEVHVSSPTTTNVIDFDSAFQLIANGSYRVLEGAASSNLDVDENVYKLFDNNPGTVYVSGPHCVGATPTWTYNNGRKEFISSYTITTGSTCNVRSPSGWRFEGSNDNGQHWTLLHEVSGELFTQYGAEKTYDFYNNEVFSQYRMVVTECSNTEISSSSTDCYLDYDYGFQLSELGLYAKSHQASCPPTEDGFSGALEGQYAYKECPSYQTGKIRALCENGQLGSPENLCVSAPITSISYPSSVLNVVARKSFSYNLTIESLDFFCYTDPSPLAHNIEFDTDTGRIHGVTNEVFSNYSFTVYCTNLSSPIPANTTVTINSTKKSGLPIWGDNYLCCHCNNCRNCTCTRRT